MKTKNLLLTFVLLASTSTLWAAYPTIQGNGTSGNPYKITTAEELLQVRDSVNTFDSPTSNLAHYELANNINMSAAEWTVPIGVVGRFFKGNFNGNGYKITGLTLGSATTPNVNQALFGIVGPATIKNIEIDVNFTIVKTGATGNNYVAGLVNTVSAGPTLIDNCRVTGTISQSNTAPSAATNLKVGGILAQIGAEVYITNCSADLNITNTSTAGTFTSSLNSVGGIVADANAGMKSGIVNCYSTGTITASNASGSISVGGIVGVRNGNTTVPLCDVFNCYSAMTIDAAQSLNNLAGVGGIFGSQNNANANVIKNCIALNPSITFKSTPATAVKLSRVAIKNNYVGNLANNYTLTSMTTAGFTAWDFSSSTGTAATINTVYGAGLADGEALTGADAVEQIADGLLKLNSYVGSNSSYNSTALKTWGAGAIYPVILNAPYAPTITAITIGNGQLTVAFTAGPNGGSAITDYKYTIDGTTYVSMGSATSPFTISGLTNDVTYPVQIKAVSAIGEGLASAVVSATPSTTSTSIDVVHVNTNVSTRNGKIIVNLNSDQFVEIYNTIGKRVYSSLAKKGINEISVSGGSVYIVKVENKISKVIL